MKEHTEDLPEMPNIESLPISEQNEIVSTDLLSQYVDATKIIFGDFYASKTPAEITEISRNFSTGGFISALIYNPGSKVGPDLPAIRIDRKLYRDMEGIWIMKDHAGSRDTTLPYIENRQIAELTFEFSADKKEMLKQPDLDSESQIRNQTKESLVQVIQEFQRALATKGSNIRLENHTLFTSDGTTWIPVYARDRFATGENSLPSTQLT